MADSEAILFGGGGAAASIGLIWQMYRVFRRDSRDDDVHARANKATDGLLVRVETLQAENRGLHDQVADLNRQVGTLEGKVQALLMTVENLTKGYTRLKTENAKLREELGQPAIDTSWATGEVGS